MTKALPYAMILILILFSCRTPAESKDQDPGEEPSAGPQLGGTYISPYGKIGYRFLRFREDGTVLSQTVLGSVGDNLKEFNTSNSLVSRGEYEVLEDGTITFQTTQNTSQGATVQYSALRRGEYLVVVSLSLKTEHLGQRSYKFFPDDYAFPGAPRNSEEKRELPPHYQAALDFTEQVIGPADEAGRSVRLENEVLRISFYSDMLFRWVEKNTGRIRQGRVGFQIPQDSESQVFFRFLDDPLSLSTEEFLKTDYAEESEIILSPINSKEDFIIFNYRKPVDQEGQILLLKRAVVEENYR